MSSTSAFSSRRVRQVARLAAVLYEPAALAERARDVQDWQCVVNSAFVHGVGGLLVTSLGRAGVELPRSVAEGAEEIMARDRLWFRKLMTDMTWIREAFDRAQVRAVVLKGPVLAERVYPEAALRPSGDLDFLVTPEAFQEARGVLRTLGFEGSTRYPGRGRFPHDFGFESPGRVRVELHWQASSRFSTTLASGPLVDRSVDYRMQDGHETRVLEPADELLYLAVHAARHRFERLRWLWEIGALMERCDGHDLDLFVERALEAEVGRAAAVTLGVLHRGLECEPAGDCARRLPQGLLLRAGLGIAGVAADPTYRQRGLLSKSLSVICEHTYRALLTEKPAVAMRQWAGAMRRSIGNLVRRN